MKTVLITGANRGLGLEMVWHFLQQEEGPGVVATCRNPEKAETLARMKANHPERLKVFEMDVTDPDSIRITRDAITSQVDQLDWLINNAGIGGFEGVYDTEPEAMVETFRVNVVGPLLVTRAFVELLGRSDGGMVFMLSSRIGSIDFASRREKGIYSYPASKAALNMVGAQLAKDLKPKGIGVILQTPGWVKTDMGGDAAKYTPTESVSKVLKVWRSLTLRDTGKFLDENGEEVPW